MSNWWEKLRKQFEPSRSSNQNLGLISHELLKRSESFDDDLLEWQNGIVSRRMKDWILSEYSLFQNSHQQQDESILFLESKASSGIIIHLSNTRYSTRDATCLMEDLRSRIRSSRYKSQMSDVKVFNRPEYVERIERHYLKPKFNFASETEFNQQYGNITIELIFRNDTPHLLKLLVNSYNDRNFTTPQSFRSLLMLLTE